MDCINLQEQLGHRYRITFDPAYNPKHVPRDKLDPWTMQILCQRGVIYPHGGDLLVAEVEGRRVTAGGRDAGDGRDGCDRCRLNVLPVVGQRFILCRLGCWLASCCVRSRSNGRGGA